MNLVITFIAILMVADALFTLTNLAKVETWLSDYFPNLDVRKVAMVEGAVGLFILALKLSTRTLS